MNTFGQIYKISVSDMRGVKKNNVSEANLVENYGLAGDAHSGSNRQVSILPLESFTKMNNESLILKAGDFAENLTTTGFDCSSAEIGRRIQIGKDILLEITHMGKLCHNDCPIKEAVGDCIMPREGIFARVLRGGRISTGDSIGWV